MRPEVIKENCNSDYFFNNSNIRPAVIDAGNEIILASWPNEIYIECNKNNDILIRSISFPYVLVNVSVLYNSKIEAGNNILLESLAICPEPPSKLIMCPTVNSAFVNYFDNWTNYLKSPVTLNWIICEQVYLCLWKISLWN